MIEIEEGYEKPETLRELLATRAREAGQEFHEGIGLLEIIHETLGRRFEGGPDPVFQRIWQEELEHAGAALDARLKAQRESAHTPTPPGTDDVEDLFWI